MCNFRGYFYDDIVGIITYVRYKMGMKVMNSANISEKIYPTLSGKH